MPITSRSARQSPLLDSGSISPRSSARIIRRCTGFPDPHSRYSFAPIPDNPLGRQTVSFRIADPTQRHESAGPGSDEPGSGRKDPPPFAPRSRTTHEEAHVRDVLFGRRADGRTRRSGPCPSPPPRAGRSWVDEAPRRIPAALPAVTVPTAPVAGACPVQMTRRADAPRPPADPKAEPKKDEEKKDEEKKDEEEKKEDEPGHFMKLIDGHLPRQRPGGEEDQGRAAGPPPRTPTPARSAPSTCR